MAGRFIWRSLISAAAVCAAALAGVPAIAGAAVAGPSPAAVAGTGLPGQSGSAGPGLSGPPAATGNLTPVAGQYASSPGAGGSAAVPAAAVEARRLGRPVVVGALTTATSQTMADPGGELSVRQFLLPVRVRRGAGWVAVDTSLRPVTGGGLAPVAVPGDALRFSGGGSGPAAVISAAGTSLALWWPGRLPVPVISGPSATYRGVLPGVDLVLTATSGQSGGFSEVLVVHDTAAARDPGLAGLVFRVSARGVRLAGSAGGGLVAAGVAGSYTAAAPVMWDSSGSLTAGTPTGPGPGARVGQVVARVSGSGSVLGLVPGRGLLEGRSTRFPVFIDPSFHWTPVPGWDQHYDEVQSACPTASHYDTTNGAYWSLGVGYDGFGDCTVCVQRNASGGCAKSKTYSGFADAYYQVKVPSQIWGGYLKSAKVYAYQTYSATCPKWPATVVRLSWTGGIGPGTDWNNKPGTLGGMYTDVKVGPVTTGSCDHYYKMTCGDSDDPTHCPNWQPESFGVLPEMVRAADEHWQSFTFELSQPGATTSSSDFWRRFIRNPYLEIQYNQTPRTPSGLAIAVDGGTHADCMSAPYPWVGKLAAKTDSVTLSAVVADGDRYDDLGAVFEYQVGARGRWLPAPAVGVDSFRNGGKAEGSLKAAVIDSVRTDGTEINWRVRAWNGDRGDRGAGYSSWSGVCHFVADPSAPPAPVVSRPVAGANCPGRVIRAGCTVSFTITSRDPRSDPAVLFVWGLDKTPSPDPAGGEVACKGVRVSCAVTLRVPSPGAHAVYAYVRDRGNTDSQVLPSGSDVSSFVAQGDPEVSYPSFGAALGARQPWDNVLVQVAGKGKVAADADGAGRSLPLGQVRDAGWGGGTVTVDGARFALADFGSGRADNLLAANQDIGLPAGSTGTSLVFLATVTDADTAAPAVDLSPDVTNAPQYAAPLVPEESAIAGAGGCDAYEGGQSPASCGVPSVRIHYANKNTADFDLAVPDWLANGTGPAALTVPDLVAGGRLVRAEAGLYALAVPLDPSEAVSSVQLPDVGNTVSVAGAEFPALHILGIAVANTTSATPGSTVPLSAGQSSWTGGWTSPPDGTYAPPPAVGTRWRDLSMRVVVQVSAGGPAVRLRLSDELGWLDQGDLTTLRIGAVTVAEAKGAGPGLTGPVQTATFGGSGSVVIPAGGDVYSDAVPLTVTTGENVAVSIYLASSPGMADLSEHAWCSACTEYLTAAGAGNQTGAKGTGYFTSARGSGHYSNILAGVDVATKGAATVVVAGDSVIDPGGRGVRIDAVAPRVSDDLAAAVRAGPAGFGVVAAGIAGNQVLSDQDVKSGREGPSLLDRLVSDVLTEPGIGTVVIDEGLEDLLRSGGAAQGNLTTYGYPDLVSLLQQWGVTVIVATPTPCGGYRGAGTRPEDACTAGVVSAWNAVDSFISDQYGGECLSGLACSYVADFAAKVEDGSSLAAAYGTGDHVNLSAAGYQAAAGTIEPDELKAVVPPG